MSWGLQTSVELDGVEYSIRTDFRAILDIITALNDPDLTDSDKAEIALKIFYPDWESIPFSQRQNAVNECLNFISNGNEENTDKIKLLDWEKDYNIIIAPINRVLGREIRNEPCHWHTFLGGFIEIGDCFFAQVVNIRNKRARGKKLDKSEQDFYKRNRAYIDMPQKFSDAESDLISQWTKGVS